MSKALHWTNAALIFGLIALGWYMVGLNYFHKWYNSSLALHKSIGMLVLGTAVLAIVWKQLARSPLPPARRTRAEQLAATGMHISLMILMIAIPVSGYLVSSSAGKPVPMFGLFDIPALFESQARLRDLAIAAHYYCGYGIGVLALGHAGAALKHQFIDRDGTLARMIWR